MESGDDLSLMRHLPDVSDGSFSFQIPGASSSENLLADDSLDFFRNADMTTAPPLASTSLLASSPPPPPRSPPPPPRQHTTYNEPLTLSQLTPRPAAEKRASKTAKSLLSLPQLSLPPAAGATLQPKEETAQPAQFTTRSQRPGLKLNINSTVHANALVATKAAYSSQVPPAASSDVFETEVPVDASAKELEVPQPLEEHASTAQELPVATTKAVLKPRGIRRRSIEKIDLLVREERKERHGTRSKQKVIEGGITKTRSTKTTSTKPVSTSSRVSEPPQDKVVQPTQPVLKPFSRANKAPHTQTHAPADEDHDSSLTADTSSSSLVSAGGVAERLLQFGQKFMNPFGHVSLSFLLSADNSFSTPTNEKPPAPEAEVEVQGLQNAKNADDVNEEIKVDEDGLLTLSQLSPRKAAFHEPPTITSTTNIAITLQQPATVSASADAPLRTSSKRPGPAEVEPESGTTHKRKKSRTDAAPAISTSNDGTPLPATVGAALSSLASQVTSRPPPQRMAKPQPPRRARLQAAGASAGSGSASGSSSKPRIAGRETRKPTTTTRRVVSESTTAKRALHAPQVFKPSSSWNDDVHLATVTEAKATTSTNVGSMTLSGSGSSKGLVSSSSSNDNKHTATLSRGKGKTEEGTSSADAQLRPSSSQSHSRSTSRSDSQSHSHKLKPTHAIPDFASIHASLSQSLAQRKENIHPTIPHAPSFCTDSRLIERRKFDEKIKEKDEREEREREEERRRRDEEEERSVREMRKGMVVKAHEVPGWYKGMPKRKGEGDAV